MHERVTMEANPELRRHWSQQLQDGSLIRLASCCTCSTNRPSTTPPSAIRPAARVPKGAPERLAPFGKAQSQPESTDAPGHWLQKLLCPASCSKRQMATTGVPSSCGVSPSGCSLGSATGISGSFSAVWHVLSPKSTSTCPFSVPTWHKARPLQGPRQVISTATMLHSTLMSAILCTSN